MAVLLYVLLGYALGSIPFGVVFAKVFGLGDLRKQGSGNIGATNVLRTGNHTAALLTMLCDIFKGFIPVFLYIKTVPDAEASSWGSVAVALACLLGHVFPVWSRFRGGKGVATAAGAYLALDPATLAVGMSLWLGTLVFLKLSSLAAMVALTGVILWVGAHAVMGKASAALVIFTVFVAVLLITTHRANIQRLLARKEGKVHV